MDLIVELSDNKATTLRITLPAHFPQVRLAGHTEHQGIQAMRSWVCWPVI